MLSLGLGLRLGLCLILSLALRLVLIPVLILVQQQRARLVQVHRPRAARRERVGVVGEQRHAARLLGRLAPRRRVDRLQQPVRRASLAPHALRQRPELLGQHVTLGEREARLARLGRARPRAARLTQRAAHRVRPPAHDALEAVDSLHRPERALACHPHVAVVEPEERRLLDVQRVLDPAVCKQHFAHRRCVLAARHVEDLVLRLSQQPRKESADEEQRHQPREHEARDEPEPAGH
eukprot:scaffold58164_cov56-Phaeocystis_antarctica.AAC.1